MPIPIEFDTLDSLAIDVSSVVLFFYNVRKVDVFIVFTQWTILMLSVGRYYLRTTGLLSNKRLHYPMEGYLKGVLRRV